MLAIDPGPTVSGWVLLVDGEPSLFGVNPTEEVLADLRKDFSAPTTVVIERVQGYGMKVGAEVIDTAYIGGRMAEAASRFTDVFMIGRKAVKVAVCGTSASNDANVRAALIERWGGKTAALGTKAAPGPLRGVTGDAWAALALGVAYLGGAR